MIQKATELGVTKFIPVITERTVVRNINYERLIKIVTEASEQSNRLSIPEIDKIQKFTSFLTALVIVSALVAFASYDHKVSNNLILIQSHLKIF